MMWVVELLLCKRWGKILLENVMDGYGNSGGGIVMRVISESECMCVCVMS